MLTPSDIYVLVGLAVWRDLRWTFRELAARLDVPVPFVQRALKRAEAAGLYKHESRQVHLANFAEFLVHAIRFVAPAKLGEVVAGVPTAWAAAPLSTRIVSTDSLPPVWPSASGRVRGQALEPLNEAAVRASAHDPTFAEALAVVDALRAGDVRVRLAAADVIYERFGRPLPVAE
jgi:DNA-binding Lrp family transcriptional regulator